MLAKKGDIAQFYPFSFLSAFSYSCSLPFFWSHFAPSLACHLMPVKSCLSWVVSRLKYLPATQQPLLCPGAPYKGGIGRQQPESISDWIPGRFLHRRLKCSLHMCHPICPHTNALYQALISIFFHQAFGMHLPLLPHHACAQTPLPFQFDFVLLSQSLY